MIKEASKQFLSELQNALSYADEIRLELFNYRDCDLDNILIGSEEVEIQYTSGHGFSSDSSTYEFPTSYLGLTIEEIRKAEKEKKKEEEERSRVWKEERRLDEIKQLEEMIPKYDTAKAGLKEKYKKLTGKEYGE